MAVIDVAGYVAELKDHAVDHGFHVHDERHFVETYSLRQAWEVDLHPEEGCNGPLDLHLALEVDPRVLLAFEDEVVDLPDGEDPKDEYHFPLTFTWALPPLPHGPDLLRLAIDLAGVGGVELPWSRRRSTATPRRPIPPSGASPSSPASRCRWPGCSPARSCCARPSTGPWPSASSCWNGRRPGSSGGMSDPASACDRRPAGPTPKAAHRRPVDMSRQGASTLSGADRILSVVARATARRSSMAKRPPTKIPPRGKGGPAHGSARSRPVPPRGSRKPPTRAAVAESPAAGFTPIIGVVVAVVAVVTVVVVSTSGGSSSSAGQDHQAAVNYTTAAGVKVYGGIGPEGVPLQVGPQLAPANTGLTGAPIVGLQCNTTEQLTYHHHAHLAIFINGQPRSIPLGTGMVPPALVQQTASGDFATGSQTCLYWLHVHAQDGIIHIESPTPKVYELAQFFAIWHVPFSANQIGSYKGTVTATVDGKPWTGNPAQIPLQEHAQVVLNLGRPYRHPAPDQLERHRSVAPPRAALAAGGGARLPPTTASAGPAADC